MANEAWTETERSLMAITGSNLKSAVIRNTSDVVRLLSQHYLAERPDERSDVVKQLLQAGELKGDPDMVQVLHALDFLK